MKKSFFYGALAVLSLAACSQNEVLDINRNGDEIKFNVVTNKATRAAAIYSNSVEPGSFNVWANFQASGTPYFAGDLVTQVGNSWTSTNTRYWPDLDVNNKLDFFAIAGCSVPSDFKVTPANATASTKNNVSFTYTVQDKVESQEDVLYAAELGVTKTATEKEKQITLNFGHALSQVVFKAKNSNSKLYVKVSGVKVAHLNNSGTFTYSEDTGNKFTEDQTGNYSDNNTNTSGSWESLSGDVTYEITRTDPIVLTANPQEIKSSASAESKTDAMILMPQVKTGWSSTNSSGTFFAVKCQIYNIAAADGKYKDGDVCLWGQNEPKYVYIPTGIDWKPGQKYIYTFDFNNGNGGFEPDPNNPDTPDPNNPVLIPITYTITVDDFDIVGQNDDTTVNG